MGENLHLDEITFQSYEKPKKYDTIKDTYIINWQENQNFLPKSYLKSFDSILFYNLIHRECFRTAIKNTSNLDQSEIKTYKNCVSKHQYAVQTFTSVISSSRKWKGFLSYIDMREYSRNPEEMGTSVPTNPIIRKKYLDMVKIKENEERKRGLLNLFGGQKKRNPLNFVYEYLLNKTNILSRLDLEVALSSKNILQEYNRLNETYGEELAKEIKSKVDLKSWNGITGDDFVAEEESTPVPESVNEEGGSLGESIETRELDSGEGKDLVSGDGDSSE